MIGLLKQDNNIVGATGEFFVAAELSRRGFIATLTIKNSPLVDVIATNLESGVTINIQVKTRSERNNQGWLLNSKVENLSNIKNYFYVFVNLENKDNLPEYYIIPNNLFAKYQKIKHQKWLNGSSKNGKVRNDSNIRNFKPSSDDRKFAEKYKNNWHIIGSDLISL